MVRHAPDSSGDLVGGAQGTATRFQHARRHHRPKSQPSSWQPIIRQGSRGPPPPVIWRRGVGAAVLEDADLVPSFQEIPWNVVQNTFHPNIAKPKWAKGWSDDREKTTICKVMVSFLRTWNWAVWSKPMVCTPSAAAPAQQVYAARCLNSL